MTRRAALGAFGLSLTNLLTLQGRASESGVGRAKSCIVFFAWGGMSQLDTFDPKPDAPLEIRGPTKPIATAVPGIRIAETLPRLAARADKLAFVRSVHHRCGGHRNGAYWNLTGHAPAVADFADDSPVMPSRRDWPCLGSQVSRHIRAKSGFPGAVCLPYVIADRGACNGQDGGFLGVTADPLVMHPGRGTAYAGVSSNQGAAELTLPDGLDAGRLAARHALRDHLTALDPKHALTHYQRMAADLLLRPEVASAFDLGLEPQRMRDRYGEHVCGQSALLARRLSEAGVPVVTIYASAGDLNGGQGDHWDTHGDNYNRIRNRLAPPLDQASAALLDDLEARGRLDETLVVWLTEFGRTPRLSGGHGRDHFPNCYSVAFAGGGIRGGQVYGRSDAIASAPSDGACGPADLHATVFRALGVPADAHLVDNLGRPVALCDGRALPLFA
ncbi:MAG: DUF1501 domain-containing protein [Gemmataceae bacterium]